MVNNSITQVIRNEGKSFFQAVGRGSEILYLMLLSLYVALFYFLKIAWIGLSKSTSDVIQYSTLSIIMWGSALYLIYVIIEWKDLWKKTVPLILVAAPVLAGTYYFSKHMSTNQYGVVMDIVFCVLAYKKDFRKILKCMLGVSVVMLLIAAIGIPLHITAEVEKPEFIISTHSLGINYPNTWAYLVFLGLMLFWYLYLRRKHIFTFAIFWVCSVIMYQYIRCKTVAGLCIVFPVMALCVSLMERRKKKNKVLGWLVIAIPFFAFVIMFVLSLNYKWLHDHFYYTWFHNLAERFVQGSLLCF